MMSNGQKWCLTISLGLGCLFASNFSDRIPLHGARIQDVLSQPDVELERLREARDAGRRRAEERRNSVQVQVSQQEWERANPAFVEKAREWYLSGVTARLRKEGYSWDQIGIMAQAEIDAEIDAEIAAQAAWEALEDEPKANIWGDYPEDRND